MPTIISGPFFLKGHHVNWVLCVLDNSLNVGLQAQILGLLNNVMPGNLGNIYGAMQGDMSGFPNNFNNMAQWNPL